MTRLVVIDYAEARVAQLVSLLPMLEAGASRLYPVRVVLLVRNRPAGAADWRDGLRLSADTALKSLLNDAAIHEVQARTTRPTCGR